jgi:hypothetical protein
MTDASAMSLVPAVEGASDDLARLKALALDGVNSPHSRRAYEKALSDFLAWYCETPRGPFRKSVVQEYRATFGGRPPGGLHHQRAPGRHPQTGS